MVKTLFQVYQVQVWSLPGELRSHRPCSPPTKKCHGFNLQSIKKMINTRVYLGEVFEVGRVYHPLSPLGLDLMCREPWSSRVWVKKRVFCRWRAGPPSWWVAITQQVLSLPWGFLQASARGPHCSRHILGILQPSSGPRHFQ